MGKKDSPSAFINCSETQQFCSKLFAIISVSSACLPSLPTLSAIPLRPQESSAAHPLLPFGFVVIYFLLLGASRRASSCLVCSPAATVCVCACVCALHYVVHCFALSAWRILRILLLLHRPDWLQFFGMFCSSLQFTVLAVFRVILRPPLLPGPSASLPRPLLHSPLLYLTVDSCSTFEH